MIFFYTSFCQNNTPKNLSAYNYLHKSKVKKTIGYSFLGAGVLLITTGVIIGKVKETELFAGKGDEFLGIISTLVSIPFFLSSTNNKRKAMSVSINAQKTRLFLQNDNVQSSQPTITIKINL